MKFSLPILALSVVSLSGFIGTQTIAQDATVSEVSLLETANGPERVKYSGKLRMLSQRIPAAACNLAAGYGPDNAQAILNSATAEFDKILNALEMGDLELGIEEAEPNRKTLARIHALKDAWAPLNDAATSMVGGDLSADHVQVLMDNNMDMLETTKSLVTVITSEYKNPAELVQADAFLIDIAGRQRMLIQKMAKESCMIASGYDASAASEYLIGTMQTYSSVLEALRFGMQSAGIRRPPTEEISTRLDGIADQWGTIEPMLDEVLAGEALEADTMAAKFDALNAMMSDMNDVVEMYASATTNVL